MKTWKIAVPVVALAVLTAASAFAAGTKMSTSSTTGSKGTWTFGIQGGLSKPTGDYNNEAKSGWNFGGQADYWFNSMWGVGADAAYHANNASDDFNAALVADPLFGTGTTAKFSVIQYGVHATYMIPMTGSQFAPYLQAGGAGYNIKEKIEGGLAPGDNSDNKFGFNVGAGVDYHATPTLNVGINGTYHDVPVNGSTFSWFGVQGRVTFKMPTSK